METWPVKRLCTERIVFVDSIGHTEWLPNRHGIKSIVAESAGVRIIWNFGFTFVPWSNVRYALGY